MLVATRRAPRRRSVALLAKHAPTRSDWGNREIHLGPRATRAFGLGGLRERRERARTGAAHRRLAGRDAREVSRIEIPSWLRDRAPNDWGWPGAVELSGDVEERVDVREHEVIDSVDRGVARADELDGGEHVRSVRGCRAVERESGLAAGADADVLELARDDGAEHRAVEALVRGAARAHVGAWGIVVRMFS